jgi:hypothetical protein
MKQESIRSAESNVIDQQTASFLEELEGSATPGVQAGQKGGSTAFPPSGEKGWGPVGSPEQS